MRHGSDPTVDRMLDGDQQSCGDSDHDRPDLSHAECLDAIWHRDAHGQHSENSGDDASEGNRLPTRRAEARTIDDQAAATLTRDDGHGEHGNTDERDGDAMHTDEESPEDPAGDLPPGHPAFADSTDHPAETIAIPGRD
jgi:hypothetical protein